MIRSLLLQLAFQHPTGEGIGMLKQLYEQCKDGQQQPTDDKICALLFALTGQKKQNFIILDALDECQDRDELLSFIRSFSALRQACILTTSRRERDIELSLNSIADEIINVQNTLVDPDISAYIHAQLDTCRELKKWPASTKDEISRELMNKANGMFRWAYCQLESLRHCVRRRDLRKTLYSLPSTLDETYVLILRRIKLNGHLEDAMTVLRWLCFSRRPLHLAELVDVLAIDKKSQNEHEVYEFDPNERLPDPYDILTICSSLISCDATGQGLESDQLLHSQTTYHNDYLATLEEERFYEADRTSRVRLAHFSVKEYLLSDRCAEDLQHSFAVGPCHETISKSCISYLKGLSQLESSALAPDITHTYPLAIYAAASWWRHALKAQANSDVLATTTTKYIVQDLLSNHQSLLTWLRLCNIDSPGWSPRFSKTATDLAPPLYYAALAGLSQVTEELLKSDPTGINSPGGFYGYPLQAAAYAGHTSVVQILLGKGADVNAQGGAFDHALHAAVDRARDGVVQLLLEAGADVNALGGTHVKSPPLYIAVDRGRETIVRLLLDAGADVNAQGGHHPNALQAAAASGHDEILQTLLDAGADVNAVGGTYGTALQVAAARNRERTVQLLIGAGADVRATGGRYGGVLQAASARGRTQVVQILLDAGIDVNHQGGHFGNALQAAAARGHIEIVRMLLAAGADVKTSSGVYGTALNAAETRRHEEIAQLLLKAGSEIAAP